MPRWFISLLSPPFSSPQLLQLLTLNLGCFFLLNFYLFFACLYATEYDCTTRFLKLYYNRQFLPLVLIISKLYDG